MSNSELPIKEVFHRLYEGYSSTLWWGNVRDSLTIHRIGDRAFITWNADGSNHAVTEIFRLQYGNTKLEKEIRSLVDQGYELILGSK